MATGKFRAVYRNKTLRSTVPSHRSGFRIYLAAAVDQVGPQTLRMQKESSMKTRIKEYPGVTGKIVEYADTFEEDGDVYIGVRFTEGTHLSFIVSAQPARITTAQLL